MAVRLGCVVSPGQVYTLRISEEWVLGEGYSWRRGGDGSYWGAVYHLWSANDLKRFRGELQVRSLRSSYYLEALPALITVSAVRVGLLLWRWELVTRRMNGGR